MNIQQAIDRHNALKPNQRTDAEKIAWLSTVDGIIFEEIIKTHEGGEGIEFHGYGHDTPLTTELLVPAPYDDIYRFCLDMQVDLANAEFQKYNNDLMLYNAALLAYSDYYNRHHMPIPKTKLKL